MLGHSNDKNFKMGEKKIIIISSKPSMGENDNFDCTFPIQI